MASTVARATRPALPEAQVVGRPAPGVGHAHRAERGMHPGLERGAAQAEVGGTEGHVVPRTVGMNSWSSGSWKTTPTRRRISLRLALVTGSPPTATSPAWGRGCR